jgi:predicted AAA+ superfamily ATPase
MVKRELWLKKIRPFYENELIKVLIGIRRSGKSIILSPTDREYFIKKTASALQQIQRALRILAL